MESEQIPADLKGIIELLKRHEGNGVHTSSEYHYKKALRRYIDGEPLINKGDTIYEIGAGEGYCFRELYNAIGPEGRYLGIDIYPEKIQAAKKRIQDLGLPNFEVYFADGRDLSKTPLKYGEADVMLLIEVLSFLNNPDALKTIDESIKAIRPDGRS